MSEYRFYGAESANIQDSSGLSPMDYYDILSRIWCAETCAPRLRNKWSADNKTMGQCSVTAFLMQDIFGGEVYGILRPGGNYHCFNVVGNCVFDLTSEQFGDEVLDYSTCTKQSRSIHFALEALSQWTPKKPPSLSTISSRRLLSLHTMGLWQESRRTGKYSDDWLILRLT